MKTKQKFRVILRIETEAERTITEAGMKRLLKQFVNYDDAPDEIEAVEIADVLDTTGK